MKKFLHNLIHKVFILSAFGCAGFLLFSTAAKLLSVYSVVTTSDLSVAISILFFILLLVLSPNTCRYIRQYLHKLRPQHAAQAAIASSMAHSFAVLGLVFLLSGSSVLTAQIAVDNTTTTTSGGGASPVTFTHTTGAGTARLMMVGISIEQDNTGPLIVSSVTYGTGMTQQTLTNLQNEGPNGEAEVQIWYLVAPQSGTNQITVNLMSLDATDALVIGATTFTGVNQTTPLGMPATSNDGTSPAQISVPDVSNNELVFGVIAHDDNRTITSSLDGGQTQLWNEEENQGVDDGITGGCARKSGPGTVQLAWTLETNDGTSMVAVALKPAVICTLPNCGTVTLVKNP
jgi:hypothetical protein